MKKNCLTCIKDSDDETDSEIPKWSLMMGNYSLLPSVLNNNSKYNALENVLKEETPTIKTYPVNVELETKSNTWVFYWAADSQDSFDKIKGPIEAYNDFTNHGLTKSNDNGKATMIIDCPQLYEVEGVVYPKHIHYVLLKSDKTWDHENVKTRRIHCDVSKESLKYMLDKSSHLVLNALPKESYEEKHIPGSLNLPHDTVLKEIPEILESYKKKTKLGKYPLNILPVVLYCAHSECSASDKLMKKLEELDMVNVSEYSGGMKEWFSTESQVDSQVTPISDNKDMYDLNIEK